MEDPSSCLVDKIIGIFFIIPEKDFYISHQGDKITNCQKPMLIGAKIKRLNFDCYF